MQRKDSSEWRFEKHFKVRNPSAVANPIKRVPPSSKKSARKGSSPDKRRSSTSWKRKKSKKKRKNHEERVDWEEIIEIEEDPYAEAWIVDRMSDEKVRAELIKRGFQPYDGPRGRDAAAKKDAKALQAWDLNARKFLKKLLQKKIPATLLMSLLQENDLDGFDLLLEQGVDIDVSDHRGCRPIHTVCEKVGLRDISDPNHLNRLENTLFFLLSRDADINVCNNVGLTPLVMCAQSGWVRGTALLLEHGASVEISSEGNFTPLFETSKAGHVDILQLLIRNGANVNVVAGNGMTPIWVAAYHGKSECVSYLLKCNADPSIQVDGSTAREAAKINGHERVLDVFDRAENVEFKQFENVAQLREAESRRRKREEECARRRAEWERHPEKHCPHGLRRFVTDHEYICDVCNETQLTDQVMFGCRICDWDTCEKCANRDAEGSETHIRSEPERHEHIRRHARSSSSGEPDPGPNLDLTDGPIIALGPVGDPGKEPEFSSVRLGHDLTPPGTPDELTDPGPIIVLGDTGTSESETSHYTRTTTTRTESGESSDIEDSDSFGECLELEVVTVVGSEEYSSFGENLPLDAFESSDDMETTPDPDLILSPIISGEPSH